MTDWELRPYEGVGPLSFGMTRDEVGQLQLGKSRVVRKTMGPLVEQFPEQGVVVHYTGASDETVGLVEFSGPEYPTWEGLPFGKGRVADTEALMASGATAATDDFGSVWFDDVGVALYSEGEDTYAVSVFSRGEYGEAAQARESGARS